MKYYIQHIAGIVNATIAGVHEESVFIEYLLTDSRRTIFPERSLFFALSSERRDGHDFIGALYDLGVRHFVVRKNWNTELFPSATFLLTDDVLLALQQLAAYHRQQFTIPVIGITGSNGKTIVKEWLYQLLQADQHIVRSPRSYNSQIGVPLSVWQMQPEHTLGIFEAGISAPGEMERLERIIQPTIGVFTNIADAHSEGFENNRQKAIEKATLFSRVQQLVFSKDHVEPALFPDGNDRSLFPATTVFFSWSRMTDATLRITDEKTTGTQTLVHAVCRQKEMSLVLPFTDRISVNNAITCWSVLLLLNTEQQVIQQRMMELAPVDMRMQLKKGMNGCYLLNDSYSNDTLSLDLALQYLKQQAGDTNTTLILSDVLQSGQDNHILYSYIASQVQAHHINRLIGIGPSISACQAFFKASAQQTAFYDSTEAFLKQVSIHQFRDEYILLKGARLFEFERITHWLEQKVHQTMMEINLTAMAHNLKAYQQRLKPSTRVMAMVKAFSYGSGNAEVARMLQFHKVDYLAVAYADEGIELRKAGINLPIMVMNADKATFDALLNYNLEPELYSFDICRSLHDYLDRQGVQQFPVHIKFNTGMNRLGFEIADAAAVGAFITQQERMVVKSVFSHLVASESHSFDEFTTQQVAWFEEACAVMEASLQYPFIKHISNSAGIFRHPAYQFDMVRLGIGLYGIDGSGDHELNLRVVSTLRSTIAQTRKVKKGDAVGYSRRGEVHRDSIIATVRIGYADGYNRRLGNGTGKMYVRGKLAPVIGSVCMDMTMIDVTDIPGVRDDDTVEIFGEYLPLQQLAAWSDTIPYEIMTTVSQRVERVYVEE